MASSKVQEIARAIGAQPVDSHIQKILGAEKLDEAKKRSVEDEKKA